LSVKRCINVSLLIEDGTDIEEQSCAYRRRENEGMCKDVIRDAIINHANKTEYVRLKYSLPIAHASGYFKPPSKVMAMYWSSPSIQF
jgi:hypothetical protein